MKYWGLLLLILVACGQSLQNAPKSYPTSDNSNVAVAPTGEIKEFTIRAFQFGYEPDTIEVNKGDTVKITAYSSDVPHGLAIPQFGVRMNLMDKTPVTTTFVADKSGTYSFFCSIPCGSGHGSMRGTLIVQ